jgi:hypothetical protein
MTEFMSLEIYRGFSWTYVRIHDAASGYGVNTEHGLISSGVCEYPHSGLKAGFWSSNGAMVSSMADRDHNNIGQGLGRVRGAISDNSACYALHFSMCDENICHADITMDGPDLWEDIHIFLSDLQECRLCNGAWALSKKCMTA